MRSKVSDLATRLHSVPPQCDGYNHVEQCTRVMYHGKQPRARGLDHNACNSVGILSRMDALVSAQTAVLGHERVLEFEQTARQENRHQLTNKRYCPALAQHQRCMPRPPKVYSPEKHSNGQVHSSAQATKRSNLTVGLFLQRGTALTCLAVRTALQRHSVIIRNTPESGTLAIHTAAPYHASSSTANTP